MCYLMGEPESQIAGAVGAGEVHILLDVGSSKRLVSIYRCEKAIAETLV